MEIFYTDCGKEFGNYTIDDLLEMFDIERTLSHKSDPYDNAVAESTYETIEVEFVYQHTFQSLYKLQFHSKTRSTGGNVHRIHDSLGHLTPMDYKRAYSKPKQIQEIGCNSSNNN